MAANFTVQNDAGTAANANAYITLAFFKQYMDDRGRVYPVDAAVQLGIVKATDYIDARWRLRFAGQKNIAYATGVLTFAGQPANGNTVTIGLKTYTFQSVLTNVDGNVAIAGTVALTILNLVNAINVNQVGVRGVDYATATTRNGDVTALATATTAALTAQTSGTTGNIVVTTAVGANLSFGSATLVGGVQTTEFPRQNILDDQGQAIVGVPINLQKACAEYALRASAAEILVDGPIPVVGGERQPTGQVVATNVTIGPVHTGTTFAQDGDAFGSGTLTVAAGLLQKIPAADMLIEPLLNAGGIQRRAIR
jgi:hypothetical protein